MASKFLHEAQRGAGRGSIDLPIALLAALSVGFVGFMLPGDVLSRAVEASRLPEFFPAAAPPLGTKARIAVALAAAGGTFAAVYLLLRMLGRKRRPEPKQGDWAGIDREPETPRLRRSDVHPDAPARRPILATRELGEPAPATTAAPPEREPTPPESTSAEEPVEELELDGPGIERLDPVVAEASADQPIAAERAVEQPKVEQPRIEQPPVREAAAERPVRIEPAAPQPSFAPARPEPLEDESIADLVARLERGLARRRQPANTQPVPAEAPAPVAAVAPIAAAAEWGDDRLRSAIENLQKMAARAH